MTNCYFMRETFEGKALVYALSPLKQAATRSGAAVSARITDKFHWQLPAEQGSWQLSQLIVQTHFHCQGQDCCHRTAWSQSASNMGYTHTIKVFGPLYTLGQPCVSL